MNKITGVRIEVGTRKTEAPRIAIFRRNKKLAKLTCRFYSGNETRYWRGVGMQLALAKRGQS